jgi:preprotein translocase subunit SecD
VKGLIICSTLFLAMGVVLSACGMGQPAAPTPGPTPGKDDAGGVALVLEAAPLEGSGAGVGMSQMEAAREITKKRLEVMELSSATVALSGTSNLQVTIPFTADVGEVKGILVQRGFIEFVDAGSSSPPTGVNITTELGGPLPEQLTPGADAVVYPVVLSSDDLLPDGVTVMTETGALPVVQLVLTPDGKTKLAEFTGSHVSSFMPVALDKFVLFSPIIQSEITEGVVAISGISDREVKLLVACVRSGVLPVRLSVASEAVVP